MDRQNSYTESEVQLSNADDWFSSWAWHAEELVDRPWQHLQGDSRGLMQSEMSMWGVNLSTLSYDFITDLLQVLHEARSRKE